MKKFNGELISHRSLETSENVIVLVAILLITLLSVFIAQNWQLLLRVNLFFHFSALLVSTFLLTLLAYLYIHFFERKLSMSNQGFHILKNCGKEVAQLNFGDGISVRVGSFFGLNPTISLGSQNKIFHFPLRLLSLKKLESHILPTLEDRQKNVLHSFISYYGELFKEQERDSKLALSAIYLLFPISIFISSRLWETLLFWSLIWSSFSIIVPLMWSQFSALIYRIKIALLPKIRVSSIRFSTIYLTLCLYFFYGYLFKIMFGA
jgi:hypothetical protein